MRQPRLLFVWKESHKNSQSSPNKKTFPIKKSSTVIAFDKKDNFFKCLKLFWNTADFILFALFFWKLKTTLS